MHPALVLEEVAPAEAVDGVQDRKLVVNILRPGQEAGVQLPVTGVIWDWSSEVSTSETSWRGSRTSVKEI